MHHDFFRPKGGRDMRVRWLVALGFLMGACFEPIYPIGIPCSENLTCPPGQTCDVDGICRLDPVSAPRCGDGVVDSGEQCDDGNNVGGDGCSATCQREECGNGILDPGEVCDDGNTVSGDGCDADCRGTGGCGNGILDPGEECDEGGVNTATCNADCTVSACGDGFVNPAAGEQCDDGNTEGGDGCSATCRREECGNGILDPGEACDDGNLIDGDGCSSTCAEELTCGNGSLDAGEEVDPPPGPATSVPADDRTCRYDFSGISQIYCAGTCGNWGGGDGCQQEDADVLCKLKTDNPNSTAISFKTGGSLAAPGICCPPPTLDDPRLLDCVPLGVLEDRGVQTPVAVHDTDLLSTHGSGQVVFDVVCTER
jgi:cysteine-rich repeat protein